MSIEIPNLDPRLVYINPTHVKVYVGEYWLDDVVACSYQVEDAKMPLYGFKSTLFDGVDTGHTIVSGELICLYRYPGYLARVLETIRSPAQKEATVKGTLGTRLTEKTVPEADAAAMLKDLFTKDVRRGREAAKEFTKIFLSNQKPGAVKAAPPVDRAGYKQAQNNTRFDLRLVYGRMDLGQTHFVQQIVQDVLLVGEGQMISVLDGQGDSCLYERYSFLARNVVLS